MIRLQDLRRGYIDLVRHVIENGEPVAPRGLPTLEVPHASFQVEDTTQTLPIGTGRGVSTKLAAVEALQLIGGFCDYSLIERAAPALLNYAEPDGTLHGAYGPRSVGQVESVIRRLRRDPHTRQAIVAVWQPDLDRDEDHWRDFPCTLSLHFMIRRDALDLHVTMRSNDVWKGVGYDCWQFTQLQHTVAAVLGVSTGRYYHTSNSLHLYTSDIELAEGLEVRSGPIDLPRGIQVAAGSEWSDVREAARAIADGVRITMPGAEWYRERLCP